MIQTIVQNSYRQQQSFNALYSYACIIIYKPRFFRRITICFACFFFLSANITNFILFEKDKNVFNFLKFLFTKISLFLLYFPILVFCYTENGMSIRLIFLFSLKCWNIRIADTVKSATFWAILVIQVHLRISDLFICMYMVASFFLVL